MDGTVLVADDDRTIRMVLTQALTRAGVKVHATSSLTTLMRWISEGKGDAVITDVMMPDGNGLEMLPKISQDRPDLPVIVISAQNTIMTAIHAAEADAYDYLPKPFDLPDLMKRCAKALSSKGKGTTVSKNNIIKSTNMDEADQALPIVGKTTLMQGLYRFVARLINSELPVLVSGESGTGKTLVAKVLHEFSDRRNMPLITLKADDLIELDGPSKILARAKDGTILIEEISDLGPSEQGRLVSMIDSPGEYAPRFVATLIGDMSEAIDNHKVRRDLFYRLGGAPITVPPLRERIEDIPLLADFFLKKVDAETGISRHFDSYSMKLIQTYTWPGNVRQLENMVKRLGLTAKEPAISLGEVKQALSNQPEIVAVLSNEKSDRLASDVDRHLRRYFDLHGSQLPPTGVYQRILKEVEFPLVTIALDATGGNQAKCANLLGINRNTLRKKISELDIQVTRQRKLM
jgi:two-component system nitrogen regulation response regulator GlnG